jgi:hypothetical protein
MANKTVYIESPGSELTAPRLLLYFRVKPENLSERDALHGTEFPGRAQAANALHTLEFDQLSLINTLSRPFADNLPMTYFGSSLIKR